MKINICIDFSPYYKRANRINNTKFIYFVDYPPKVISMYQLPNSTYNYVAIKWVIEARRGDLPLLGFHIKVICKDTQSIFIPLSQLKSITNKDNSTVFQYQLKTRCLHISTTSKKRLSMEIQSVNSYLFSTKLRVRGNYQYFGMKSFFLFVTLQATAKHI